MVHELTEREYRGGVRNSTTNHNIRIKFAKTWMLLVIYKEEDEVIERLCSWSSEPDEEQEPFNDLIAEEYRQVDRTCDFIKSCS